MVGCNLIQIRLGGADVQFVFDPAVVIAVQSRVVCLNAENTVATWDGKNGWDSIQFQSLLNATVSSYSVVSDRLLEIRFAEGLKLQLFDNSDQFESMQIYVKGDELGPIVI